MGNNKLIFNNNYPKLHGQKSARLLFVLNEIPGELLMAKYPYLLAYDTIKDDATLHAIDRNEVYKLLIFLGDKDILFTTFRKDNEENFVKYDLKIGEMFDIEINGRG